eukprot:364862-Chlamydomonas_euryale.AAC.9
MADEAALKAMAEAEAAVSSQGSVVRMLKEAIKAGNGDEVRSHDCICLLRACACALTHAHACAYVRMCEYMCTCASLPACMRMHACRGRTVAWLRMVAWAPYCTMACVCGCMAAWLRGRPAARLHACACAVAWLHGCTAA